MTEDVLAFDLTVKCVDGAQHQGVELRATETSVSYITSNGKKLKGKTEVKSIEAGNFLAPLHTIESAIQQYRRQQ